MAGEIFVNKYILGSSGTASDTTADNTAAAAVLTISNTGKDQKRVLRVENANTTSIIASISAGDGPRATLGPMNMTVEASATTYIALFDSARFKNLSTGFVTVTLKDAAGTANLEAASLANVRIEVVQM